MNSKPLEKTFQKKLKLQLNKIEGCYHFTKEAGALRGIPDIIGCLNGTFFAFEVKRDGSSLKNIQGREALQAHNLKSINRAGGFAMFVYPENMEEALSALHAYCFRKIPHRPFY